MVSTKFRTRKRLPKRISLRNLPKGAIVIIDQYFSPSGWGHPMKVQFLGITKPGDIYGEKAEKGLYEPLSLDEARIVWAKYYSEKLGKKVPPTWKAIEDAYYEAEEKGLVRWGDHPYMVVKELEGPYKGEIGAYFYRYKNKWVHGSGAYPIRLIKVIKP